MSTNVRNVQAWPCGVTYRVSGEYPHFRVYADCTDTDGREATPDETRAIQVQELAEAYVRNDVLCCDSALVSALMERGDIDGFSCDDIENAYADPSDWNLEQCRDYLQDHGAELPGADPWEMEADALIEALTDVGYEDEDLRIADGRRESEGAYLDVDTLRGMLVDEIETSCDIDDWRDAVSEYSSDNPQEAYEWWRVTGWLCQRLRDIGEIVIDNDYGYWWGRTCTGQSLLMDGTLQQVAYNSLDAVESYSRQ